MESTRNGLPVWYKKWALVAVVGVVVHFSMYANGLLNADSLWSGTYNMAGNWELSLGRWGIFAIDQFQFGAKFSVLGAVFVIAGFAFISIHAVNIFAPQLGKWGILIALTIICHPMLGYLITYRYCAVAYSLGSVFGLLACYIPFKVLPGKKGLIVGMVCLCLSLSIYQSNISLITLMLWLILLVQLIQTKEIYPTLFYQAKKAVLLLFGGVGSYYIILKAILLIKNIGMSEYKNASQVGIVSTVKNIPYSFVKAYKDFFDYLFGNSIIQNSYGITWENLYLILIAGGSFVWWCYKREHSIVKIVLVAMMLLVMPLATCSIDIFAPFSAMNLFLCHGLIFVPSACCVLTAAFWEPAQEKAGFLPKMAKTIYAILIGMLCWSMILQTNTDAALIKSNTSTTVNIAEMVLTDLRQRGINIFQQKICLVGVPSKGNFPMVYPLVGKADEFAKMDIITNTIDGNGVSWWQLYNQYIGINLYMADTKETQTILESKEFKNMPCYPAEGSICEIDHIITIKISEMN